MNFVNIRNYKLFNSIDIFKNSQSDGCQIASLRVICKQLAQYLPLSGRFALLDTRFVFLNFEGLNLGTACSGFLHIAHWALLGFFLQ